MTYGIFRFLVMSELSTKDRRRWFRLRQPGHCHDSQLWAERFFPPKQKPSTITSGGAPNTLARVSIRLLTLKTMGLGGLCGSSLMAWFLFSK
jgi:hypothetical protein